MVLKDTLRVHGIPAGWIGCEVSVSQDKSGGEDLVVQLIIMKWNEALLRFAGPDDRAVLQAMELRSAP